MRQVPSNMTKQASELATLAFIEERYRTLGIAEDPAALFDQAAILRKRIERHRSHSTMAIPIGAIAGFVAFGVLVSGLRPFGLDIASAVGVAGLVGVSWALIDFGFRSEGRARYGKRRAGQPRYEIEGSEIFARAFEPVETGACQLALLSVSGTSTSFTPVSDRAVERYIVKKAFDDAWLPAEILYEPSRSMGDDGQTIEPEPDYLIIRWREVPKEPRSPSGQWKQYYLWHLEPAQVGALFDRAKGIYPDKRVERMKARIAVTMVCEHFEECNRQKLKPKSQAKLAIMLENQLVVEANWRLASGEIDELEARRLSRISISGEQKSIDPADPKAGLRDKPQSWFNQLLSGDNDTILPHIRAEAIKDQPDLPTFMEK